MGWGGIREAGVERLGNDMRGYDANERPVRRRWHGSGMNGGEDGGGVLGPWE